MMKGCVGLVLVLSALSLGCQNYGDPMKLAEKHRDQVFAESFAQITNGMSKSTVLRILGRPSDAYGESMHWIVYRPGRSVCVTFRDSVVTNVERCSWVEDSPHEK